MMPMKNVVNKNLALVGQAVFLKAAVGLVRDRHFQERVGQQGFDDLVPELGTVRPAPQDHEFQQRLAFRGVSQNFDLFAT